MSRTIEVVRYLDWKLLRKQKNYLINEEQNNSECSAIYSGLANLIDAIQDAAVEDGLATERKVFGKKHVAR